MEEAAHSLRERERLLAGEYGVGDPLAPLDGEDLETADRADVEYWVDVYAQLVDFTRSILSASPWLPDGGDATPEQAPTDLRMLMLQAQVQELHLSYWLDRLQRVRAESGPGGDLPV